MRGIKTIAISILTLGLLTSSAVGAAAQEDETGDDDEGWGKLIAEFGSWMSEPGGLPNGVATVEDPLNVFSTRASRCPSSPRRPASSPRQPSSVRS